MLADVGPVVVVDDDLPLQQMVTTYLEGHNVPTRSASNRAELNRHLRGNSPSLVILDLRLGQDDGLDLLKEIRSHSDVPVIVTTGDRPGEVDRIVGLELAQLARLEVGFGDFTRIGVSRINRLVVAEGRFGRVVTTLGIFFRGGSSCDGASRVALC